MIELQNIYKNFGDKVILRDLNLQVARGEVLSIVGPSGMGKTTLLRCIKKLEKIQSGRILLNGIDIASASNQVRQIGYVFQDLYLFPNFSVKDNLDLPLKVIRKLSTNERGKLIDELLDQMGILDKKYNYPTQLSGGQQQRVAIARTLAMNPEAILFDEPTSALDNALKAKTFTLINDLAKQRNLAIITVTHETDLAQRNSDRVASLENGALVFKI